VLTNSLLDLFTKTSEPKTKLLDLEEALKRYQALRQKRAKMFVDLSGMVTRNDALATLKHTIRFLYMEPLSGEMLAGM
jgi:FAD dependent monooxygenase